MSARMKYVPCGSRTSKPASLSATNSDYPASVSYSARNAFAYSSSRSKARTMRHLQRRHGGEGDELMRAYAPAWTSPAGPST